MSEAQNPRVYPPRGLGSRGRRLWRDLSELRPLDASEQVLIEEACRISDRLDKLNALLTGEVESWARLQLPRRESDDEVTLVIDGCMAEARQQALALRQIVSTVFPAGKRPQSAPRLEVDPLDELAARRGPAAAASS